MEEQLREVAIEFEQKYKAAEDARGRRNQLVRAAWKAGLSQQQITRATGLTSGRISQIVAAKPSLAGSKGARSGS